MKCSICGSENVKIKREKQGEIKGTKRKSKSIYSNHNAIWWLCIGWLILICDISTLGLFHLLSFRNEGNTSLWHTVAICQKCGNTWETSAK